MMKNISEFKALKSALFMPYQIKLLNYIESMRDRETKEGKFVAGGAIGAV